MDNQDVRNVVSALDAVLNEAMFDLVQTQMNYERESTALQTRTSELILDGKTEKAGAKPLSDEAAKNSARVQVASEGYYDSRLEAERKYEFMKVVVDLVKEKRALLSISYGTLKIESNMG